MPDKTPNAANPNEGAALPPVQSSPPAVPPASPPSAPPGKTPRSRKPGRWVLRLLAVLLIFIAVIVLLAPSIAGLGFVRSIVVDQVNKNINGSVEIGGYSVGWTGISASDVKIFDAQKNLILQLNKFSTNLSLLGALKGNFALGDTVVDVDMVRAEVGDDGQLNYLKLLKQQPKAKSGEPKESASKPESTSLPDVSGKITVNFKGTLYQGDNALVQIQPSTAVIDIPSINQPITDNVTFTYSVNGGTAGTIQLAGNASAVKNNQLDVNSASADEKLDLTDVNLKALSPLLQLLSPSLKLQTEGTASGSLAIKAAGADSMTAAGQMNVAKFAVSGAPLKGTDRLAIDQITVPIDIARTTKDGQPFIDVKHADVLLNGGTLGKITIVASAPQDALISAAALVPAVMQRALLGTEPQAQSLTVNGEGSAILAADFDVAAIASQLPATIGLQQGMQLTQGHLSHQTTITISKDTAKIDTDTKLPDLAGTSDGKPVQLSPIDMAAGLSAVGGTSPDVHDLSVHLSSGFLSVSGGGATLSQEKLTGNFDLANLQAQLSQFVDLDTLLNAPAKSATKASSQPLPHVQLAGSGTFDLSTDGNLIKPDGQAKVATSLTINGIDARGIGSLPPIKLANLNTTLSGDLQRSATTVDYQNFAATLNAGGIMMASATAGAPPILENETITGNLKLAPPSNAGGGAQTFDASLDSDLISVKLSNASVELPSAKLGIWDILQHADVALNVPDLPKAYNVVNAFSSLAAAQANAIFPEGIDADDHAHGKVFKVALDPSDTPSPTETPLEAARRRKRERAAARAKAAAQAKAQADETPPPPLQITSGSLAGTISLNRDASSQTTTLNVSDLAISKLALARGDSKYAFARDVDFKLAVAVKASDDSSKPSPIAQIQQIAVTQLEGDLSVGKITMPQPIVINNPGDTSQTSARGTINVDGTLTDATPLLAILEGAEKPMPYGGTYALSQAIGSGTATQGNLLNLVGSINLTNFEVLDDNGKAVYTEPTVAIKNDLDYIIAKTPPVSDAATTAPSARPPRSNDQAIVRSLTLDMPSSQALAIKFSGRVADPFNKRVIRGIGSDPTARLDLTYDLAKLWPIVEPTLSPEMQAKYKTLKVIGKEARVFNVSGYFPLARTTAESMHHLNADGGFALDELDLPQGLTITKLDLPFKMIAGVVQTAPSAKPQTIGGDTTQPFVANTAICNQGAVDLSQMTLDMGQPSPVLTIAPNHVLLKNVRVNPVLAGSLGEGNLLFKDATQANGLLDVTVVQCDQVPLGELITHGNDANATITYSVSDLSIDGPVPQALSSVLPMGGQGIHGGIQDGKLTLANGEVNNDFALNIIRYVQPSTTGQPAPTGTSSATPTDAAGDQLVPVNMPLKFSGGVLLASGALKNFLVSVPQGLLPAKWASLFPNGLSVPFTGSSGHPTLDIEKAVIQNGGAGLLGGSGNGGAGGLLDGLLKKHKKKQPPGGSDSSGQ